MSKFLIIIITLITFNSFSQDFAKNRIIAKYKTTQQKTSPEVESLLSKYQLKKIVSLSNFNLTNKKVTNNEILLFTFKENINIKKAIAELENTEYFEYVEPDYIGYGAGKRGVSFLETTPSDTHFNRQWGLRNDGTFSLSTAINGVDVDMDLAWDTTTGNSNIIIAVLDSGIKMDHPEFSGRIWTNSDESINGTDSDNNGFLDDINGWDFVNEDNNPTDDHGHGTNVAGIIAANGNNSIGYAGVDWKCKIMPLKILDDNNSGFYSHWIFAINYAVNNGAKILNMSVGGSGFSQGMKSAVDYAHSQNVIVTVSMMNFNNNTPYYPAAYANTIAVGSTDSDDTRTNPFFWSSSSGSNFGSHIDVIAPGNYIYGLSYSSNTNYNTYWGGTSQAAPLVAGICSLILDQNPNLTVEQIRTILRDSAEDQVGNSSEDIAGWDQYYGTGRVNARFALDKILSVSNTSNLSIVLFPNPFANQLHIPNNAINNKFIIYNTLGKEIERGILTKNAIDLKNLKSGVYIFKTISDKGITINKIIKN